VERLLTVGRLQGYTERVLLPSMGGFDRCRIEDAGVYVLHLSSYSRMAVEPWQRLTCRYGAAVRSRDGPEIVDLVFRLVTECTGELPVWGRRRL